MTLAVEFHNWQTHQPEDDPRFNSCSPNITALRWELSRRWGMTFNGCYVERDIRNGATPSSHSHGAAVDENYPDRVIAKTEILPWLIDNSLELHIQAIHDYFGSRIWRAGRLDGSDGWRAQTPSPATGMGQAWAKYFHIETNLTGWADSRPIADRFTITPPVIVPPSGAIVFTRTIKPGDQGADVAAVQIGIHAPGNPQGNKDIIVDGVYAAQTVAAVKAMQQWWGLTPDGYIGPLTQAKFMVLFNS